LLSKAAVPFPAGFFPDSASNHFFSDCPSNSTAHAHWRAKSGSRGDPACTFILVYTRQNAIDEPEPIMADSRRYDKVRKKAIERRFLHRSRTIRRAGKPICSWSATSAKAGLPHHFIFGLFAATQLNFQSPRSTFASNTNLQHFRRTRPFAK
jgi:hypothetical protein